LGISCAVNVIWLILGSLTAPARYTRLDTIVEVLGTPGGTVAEWFAPPGHDLAHFLGGVLIALVSSILFYAGLAWAVLSVPEWVRDAREAIRDLRGSG
jgi:hypothetical protein